MVHRLRRRFLLCSVIAISISWCDRLRRMMKLFMLGGVFVFVFVFLLLVVA
jgi:hypothetical protein